MLQTPQPTQCQRARRLALILGLGTGKPRHGEPTRERRKHSPPQIDNDVIHQLTPHVFHFQEPYAFQAYGLLTSISMRRFPAL